MVEGRPLAELAVERECTSEVPRTCSKADPLRWWMDAPQSLSGACEEEMVSAAFLYLSFSIQESQGEVYINSSHRVTSTWNA